MGASGSDGWELGQHSPGLRCAHQAAPPHSLPGSHEASSLARLAEAAPESRAWIWGCSLGGDPRKREREVGV